MLEADIQALINQHLPAQVGDVLRKRLEMANEADKKIVEQGKIIKDLRSENERLTDENVHARKILDREASLVVNEVKQREAQINLDKQAAVLEARNALICNALERDERILGLVFGNNRFKYNSNVREEVAFPPHPPSANNQYPCPTTAVQSRSVQVEGEGQVPVQPTGPITP